MGLETIFFSSAVFTTAMEDGRWHRVPRCRIVDREWVRGAGGGGQADWVGDETDANGVGVFYNIESLQSEDRITDEEHDTRTLIDEGNADGAGPDEVVEIGSSQVPEWVPPEAANYNGGKHVGDIAASKPPAGGAQRFKGKKPIPPRFQPPEISPYTESPRSHITRNRRAQGPKKGAPLHSQSFSSEASDAYVEESGSPTDLVFDHERQICETPTPTPPSSRPMFFVKTGPAPACAPAQAIMQLPQLAHSTSYTLIRASLKDELKAVNVNAWENECEAWENECSMHCTKKQHLNVMHGPKKRHLNVMLPYIHSPRSPPRTCNAQVLN